jgi:putative membrane protein insertion efficiency factor
MKYILIQILKGYKYFISPFLGNRCRFYPSCSEYMMTAIDRFGIFKGIGLGIKRLGRCHPGCEGGIDHVPELNSSKNEEKCEHNHD